MNRMFYLFFNFILSVKILLFKAHKFALFCTNIVLIRLLLINKIDSKYERDNMALYIFATASFIPLYSIYK